MKVEEDGPPYWKFMLSAMRVSKSISTPFHALSPLATSIDTWKKVVHIQRGGWGKELQALKSMKKQS